MDARSRRLFIVALALLVVGGVVMPAVLADSHEYRISVNGSVPIPEQTKEIDESGVTGEFTFSEIKAVAPGEEFTAEVDGIPERERESAQLNFNEFDGDTLRLRDFDHDLEDGKGTFVAFDDPGLWFLSVDTGTIESLYPIVIEKYNVDVDWEEVPSTGESGSEIDVRANITLATTQGKQSLERGDVDVVIANEETLYNETLPVEEIPDHREYFIFDGSVTISENSLPPDDDYSVYVAVRGPEKLEGLRVPAGISEKRAFEVTESSIPTPTPTTMTTPTPTEETSAVTTTPPETPTGTDDTSTLPPLQPHTGTLEPADESTPTDTEGGIITPGVSETGSPGVETTTDGQPGFTAIIAALGILFGAVLLRRR